MGNFGGGGLRQTGVVPNVPADDRRAPARTVQHLAKVEMFAVELGDESGQKVTTVVFKVGNAWYTDPNGETWAQKLRPIVKDSWLFKQLNSNLAQAVGAGPGSVPKEDAVDLFPDPKKAPGK